MPTRATIEDFLGQKHLAFVGVSRDSKAFANAVYRHLRDGGRTLYPVNAASDATTIEEDACYRRLADVPDPVDGVVVMVPHEAETEVVRLALQRGIPRVWIHRASVKSPVSEEIRSLCRDSGVDLVDGACPFMWAEPVRGVHRIHRGLSHRRFAA